jgi:hypothetical protein
MMPKLTNLPNHFLASRHRMMPICFDPTCGEKCYPAIKGYFERPVGWHPARP